MTDSGSVNEKAYSLCPFYVVPSGNSATTKFTERRLLARRVTPCDAWN